MYGGVGFSEVLRRVAQMSGRVGTKTQWMVEDLGFFSF